MLNTFWAIEIPIRFWREGTVSNFDSRYIKRLARAYGHATAVDIDGCGRYGMESMIKDRCEDFAWERLASFSYDMTHVGFTSKSLPTAAGLTLAGICYGGLHLTAWTCQFPTNAETVLWRAASVTIMATGPTIIIVVFYTSTIILAYPKANSWMVPHDSAWRHWNIPTVELIEDVETATRYTLFFLWEIWYLLCRVFIVVECFIMLAHLPDTTLEIPSWATYIPHIT